MIVKYLNLVKFSHTIFALPFALIGFFVGVNRGDGHFSIYILMAVIACMVFARNAAMGFNRYADRDIDIKNDRTANREIPSGVISPTKALMFIIINSLLFIATAYLINFTAFMLSPVALIVILGYSLTKRFTWMCHIILGLSLAIAPSAAYIAVTGALSTEMMIFSGLVLGWVSGFDIIYALQDEEFDSNENLYSVPAFFGRSKALLISASLHLITIILVFYLYFTTFNTTTYLIGALLFCGLLIYQHYIVRPNDISRVNLAFATLNGIGSVVYSIFTILSL